MRRWERKRIKVLAAGGGGRGREIKRKNRDKISISARIGECQLSSARSGLGTGVREEVGSGQWAVEVDHGNRG